MPPSISVTLSTSTNGSPPTIDLARLLREHGLQAPHGDLDRVPALPRPRRVGALAREGDLGGQVAEAARLDRVVGRLHDHDERRLVQQAGLEHGRQRALRGRAAPRAGRRGTPRRARAPAPPRRSSARARPSRRPRPSCRSRPRPQTAPSSIRPGEVVLRRDGVEVAGEDDEVLARRGAASRRGACSRRGARAGAARARRRGRRARPPRGSPTGRPRARACAPRDPRQTRGASLLAPGAAGGRLRRGA